MNIVLRLQRFMLVWLVASVSLFLVLFFAGPVGQSRAFADQIDPVAGTHPCDAVINNVVSLKTRLSTSNIIRACISHSASELIIDATIQQVSLASGGSRVNNIGFGDTDFLGVGINTDGSATNVYYFLVTPNGTKYELESQDRRYRAQWTATVSVTGSSWHASMRIPAIALNWKDDYSNHLRINLVGQILDRRERYTWGYSSAMLDDVPPRWPHFTDAQYWQKVTEVFRIHKRKLLTSAPFLLETAGGDHDVFVSPTGEIGVRKLRPFGTDEVFTPQSGVRVSISVDPDFSNAESDQVTITPLEFQKSYTDLRPFFAQDIGIFSAPATSSAIFQDSIFYSPIFDSVDSAAKVVITKPNYSIGALSFTGSSVSANHKEDATVVSASLFSPNRNKVAWFLGSKSALDGKTGTAESVGFSIKPYPTLSVTTEYSRAKTGTSAPGYRLATNIDYSHLDNRANVQYVDISPSYSSLSGYTTLTDIKGFGAFFVEHVRTSHSHLFESFDGYEYADRYVDRSGASHLADVSLDVGFTLRRFPLRLYGGLNNSELRTYTSGFNDGSGLPNYRSGQEQYFNGNTVSAFWREGSPHQVSISYNWGPYGSANRVSDALISIQEPIGHLRGSLTYELVHGTSLQNSFLRRFAVGGSIDSQTDFSASDRLLGVRSLGNMPNFSFSLHRQTERSEIYLEYGSPATNQTFHRFLVKQRFKF